MLIVLPLGLFVAAVAFAALFLITGSGNLAVSGAYPTGWSWPVPAGGWVESWWSGWASGSTTPA